MGTARIVAGGAKGRSVLVPEGVRPTSGLARKRIFDTLGDLTRLARALDLYAGSGVLSAELLSRGVRSLVAVECSRRIAVAWRRNMDRLGFTDRAEILVMRVERALRRLGKRTTGFDLIVADPPYGSDEVKDVLSAFTWSDLLEDGGTLVIEQSRRESQPSMGGLAELWSKQVGDTAVYAYGRW